jgi:predicted alpha/beta hydrolase
MSGSSMSDPVSGPVSGRMTGTAPQSCLVVMPDGSASRVLMYPPTPGIPARPLVVIWPGFGMGAHYYRPIAAELASRGFPVAVGELRGQGSSTALASFSDRWGYHDLATQDYPRTVRSAKSWFDLPSDYPTVFLTHSMGGQIGALVLARPEAEDLGLRGMMGVGTGTPFHRAFPNPERRRLRLGAVMMPAVSRLLGHWPSGPLDITNYGRQSDVQLREWARFGRRNALDRLRGRDIDYMAALQKLRLPVLLTRFSNDDDCPRASAEALARLMPKAYPHVEEFPETLGHNRWAREPGIVAGRFERFIGEIGL